MSSESSSQAPNRSQLQALVAKLQAQYEQLCAQQLDLDLTRGKPCTEQVTLSDSLDGILNNDYRSADGTDVRNYGGLDGLAEAKTLFADVLGLKTEEILIGGNSSLNLMYQVIEQAYYFGLQGEGSAWKTAQDETGETVKFLCPVPGYDRHFTVCEEFGIEMLNVAMNDEGPDIAAMQTMVKSDPMIKGVWCVPRFSNPTGAVYSDAVVEAIAQLPSIAGDNFLLMWDNAYAVHSFSPDAPALAPIMDRCRRVNTTNNVMLFGSTSKITFAGAGVAFMGSSEANLAAFKSHLGAASIGPDKVNQLRHVKFLKDRGTMAKHMAQHAAIMAPRFAAVLDHLNKAFAANDDAPLGRWSVPEGGYFVSFDTRPGLAKAVVSLAAAAGVKLTPAGATYPYGLDPQDRNIRIAPTYPGIDDINQAMAIFVVCVKLASARQQLESC